MRFLRFLRHLPLTLRGALLWSRARDEMVRCNFERALRILTDLDEQFPNDPENMLMRADCNVRIHDYEAAKVSLKNIEAQIVRSKRKAAEKKYLKLYSDFLRGYMDDKTGKSAELKRIRSEVAELKSSVSSTLVRLFPML